MSESFNTSQSADSRLIAFFDECGDHSLEKIDPDFPIFVLALVVMERKAYRDQILPAFNSFKLKFFNHEGINLHSREIRRSYGPFALLRNPLIRPKFLAELGDLVDAAPYTLFVSAIHKGNHFKRYGTSAANPYELALVFTMERLLHYLKGVGETTLPIVAQARGKKEDNELEKVFYRVMTRGTDYHSADEFKKLNCWLTFQPKTNNIIGTQIADLSAYPCARKVLSPAQANQPYETVQKKLYSRAGISGWKVFP